MRPTNAKVFADTNVLLYLFSDDLKKKEIAESILGNRPMISTQVIAETINVLFKKYRSLPDGAIQHHMEHLQHYCPDCIILATASANNCETRYSEDLQHRQVIEECLTIVNPFLEK